MNAVSEDVPPSGSWCSREDVDVLVRLRDARTRLSSDFARGGTLADVLDKCGGESFLGDSYVVKILEARPTIGKVEARKLMDRHHLAVRSRAGDVPVSVLLAIDEDLASSIGGLAGEDLASGRTSV